MNFLGEAQKMFRADKPLPALPKDALSKIGNFASSAAQSAAAAASASSRSAPGRPAVPKKPHDSGSSPGGGKAPSVSETRSMFEAATSNDPKAKMNALFTASKYVPTETLVNAAKRVDTDTYVHAAQAANPNAKHVPLAGMINAAKKVDTNTYVSAHQTATSAYSSYSTHQQQQSSTSTPPANVSSIRSQLETKLTFGGGGGSRAPSRAPPARPTVAPHRPAPTYGSSTTSSSSSSYGSRPSPSSYGGTKTSPNAYHHTSSSASTATANGWGSPPSTNLSEPHGIALYDFEGRNFDEVTCTKGDVLLLQKRVDADWVYGQNKRTGAHGIVPRNFLNIKVKLPASAAIYSSQASTKSEVKPWLSTGPRCKALFDYESTESTDLNFRANDIIQLTERIDADWLRGRAQTGASGMFPQSFVKIIEDVKKAPAAKTNASSNILYTAEALYDYQGESGDDLSFRAGERINVTEEINADWLKGHVTPARSGMFPASFVKRQGGGNAMQSQSPTSGGSLVGRTVVALYDYHDCQQADLYFDAGDKIKIIEEIDADWLKGSVVLNMTNQRSMPPGLLPRAWVQID